jgi:hypothetical protein
MPKTIEERADQAAFITKLGIVVSLITVFATLAIDTYSYFAR